MAKFRSLRSPSYRWRDKQFENHKLEVDDTTAAVMRRDPFFGGDFIDEPEVPALPAIAETKSEAATTETTSGKKAGAKK